MEFPTNDYINPYEAPSVEYKRRQEGQLKVWVTRYLWIFGLAGAIPPLPLFYWVYDGEPFVGPWFFRDVMYCALSAAVALGWLFWILLHAFAVYRGWNQKIAVVLWVIPILFSPLCLWVCYLYLHDRRVL